jgi:hypothetical protein
MRVVVALVDPEEAVAWIGSVGALHKAGFGEVGTLWQLGGNRLLCGVLGTAAGGSAG